MDSQGPYTHPSHIFDLNGREREVRFHKIQKKMASVVSAMSSKTSNEVSRFFAPLTLLEPAHTRFGQCSGCWMAVFVPLVLILGLGAIAMQVAAVVFGVQGLVVGSSTYAACHEAGVWMIVFGCLTIPTGILQICTPTSTEQKDATGEKSTRFFQNLICMLCLTCFAWLCYGLYLIDTKAAELEACNPSQYDVFKMAVLVCFWGEVAVLVGMIAMACFSFCLICATPPKQ
jgi:hypothetical protein